MAFVRASFEGGSGFQRRNERARVIRSHLYRVTLTAGVLVLITFGIATWAQQASILSSLGGFFTAGGTSSGGSIEITGSLGSAYSTVPIQASTGLRVDSGLLMTSTSSATRGDIDGDSDVDFADFLLFATAFGADVGDPLYRPQADTDSNGTVDFGDFLTFAEAFGG